MRAFLLPIVLAISFCTYAAVQLDDILKKADSALDHRDTSGLSDAKIIAGLKQALEISTSKAVATTGKPDGFLKNEAIKILLPPKLETVGRGLRPALVKLGERLLADLPGEGDAPWVFGFPSDRHFRLGERVFGYRPLLTLARLAGPLPEPPAQRGRHVPLVREENPPARCRRSCLQRGQGDRRQGERRFL